MNECLVAKPGPDRKGAYYPWQIWARAVICRAIGARIVDENVYVYKPARTVYLETLGGLYPVGFARKLMHRLGADRTDIHPMRYFETYRTLSHKAQTREERAIWEERFLHSQTPVSQQVCLHQTSTDWLRRLLFCGAPKHNSVKHKLMPLPEQVPPEYSSLGATYLGLLLRMGITVLPERRLPCALASLLSVCDAVQNGVGYHDIREAWKAMGLQHDITPNEMVALLRRLRVSVPVYMLEKLPHEQRIGLRCIIRGTIIGVSIMLLPIQNAIAAHFVPIKHGSVKIVDGEIPSYPLNYYYNPPKPFSYEDVNIDGYALDFRLNIDVELTNRPRSTILAKLPLHIETVEDDVVDRATSTTNLHQVNQATQMCAQELPQDLEVLFEEALELYRMWESSNSNDDPSIIGINSPSGISPTHENIATQPPKPILTPELKLKTKFDLFGADGTLIPHHIRIVGPLPPTALESCFGNYSGLPPIITWSPTPNTNLLHLQEGYPKGSRHRNASGGQCSCLLRSSFCRHVLSDLLAKRFVLFVNTDIPAVYQMFDRAYTLVVAGDKHDFFNAQRLVTGLPLPVTTTVWRKCGVEVVFPPIEAFVHNSFNTSSIRVITHDVGDLTLTLVRPRGARLTYLCEIVAFWWEESNVYDYLRGVGLGLLSAFYERVWSAITYAVQAVTHWSIYHNVLTACLYVAKILGLTAVAGLGAFYGIVLAAKILTITYLYNTYKRMGVAGKLAAVLTSWASPVGPALFGSTAVYEVFYESSWTSTQTTVLRQPPPSMAVERVFNRNYPSLPETLPNFRNIVATKTALTLPQIAGVFHGITSKTNDVPNVEDVNILLTNAARVQEFNTINRGMLMIGRVPIKGRGACWSCAGSLRGMGHCKFGLGKCCIANLSNTQGVPKLGIDEINLLNHVWPHTGGCRLLPINSTAFSPPDAEFLLNPSRYITTNLPISKIFDPRLTPITKRINVVGVAHPGYFPTVQPRGPGMVLMGLLTRTYRVVPYKPEQHIWEFITAFIIQTFPPHLLESLHIMSYDTLVTLVKRVADYTKALKRLRLEGLPEIKFKVFGKTQLIPATEYKPPAPPVKLTRFKPRIIYVPPMESQIVLGAVFRPGAESVKELFPLESCCFYASGAKPKKLLELLHKIRGLDGWVVAEGDVACCETSHTKGSFDHCYTIMQKFFCQQFSKEFVHCYESYAQPSISSQSNGYYFKGTVKMMPSGSIGTTVLTGLMVCSAVLSSMLATVLKCGIKDLPNTRNDIIETAKTKCFAAIAGDDMLVMFDPCGEDPTILYDTFLKHMAACGLEVKLKITNTQQMVFLAMTPYYCEEKTTNGMVSQTYMWGPVLGRRLYKHHCALDIPGDPRTWLGEVAHMEAVCYGHVPILYDIAVRVLAIMGKRLTPRKSMLEKLHAEDEYRAAIDPHAFRYNDRTLNELAERYRVQPALVQDCLANINKIDTIPFLFSHPFIDIIMAHDDR